MKNIALTLLLLYSIQNLMSQLPQYPLDWVNHIPGPGNLSMSALAPDSSGNIYAIGTFAGTVDFDAGPGIQNITSIGSGDLHIVKYDPWGNLIWVRQIGGLGANGYCNSVAVDSSGALYFTGWFQDTMDFNPGPPVFDLIAPGTLKNIFICKLDSSGNFAWAKSIGTTNNDEGMEIAVDQEGNSYTTGYMWGSVDFNPGGIPYLINSGTSADIFICKYNPQGALVWAKNLPGGQGQVGNSLCLDENSNIYMTGWFISNCDFDPGPGTFTLSATGGGIFYDAFVCKLDSAANFRWALKIGGNDNDKGNAIALDQAGYVVVTGDFKVSGDFDPGAGIVTLISNGLMDGFIEIVDTNGTFFSATSFGSTLDDTGIWATQDYNGNVVLGGTFEGSVDFNPSASTYYLNSGGGTGSFFLTILTPWLYTNYCALTSNNNLGCYISKGVFDPFQDFFLSGTFGGTVDFDLRPNQAFSIQGGAGSHSFVSKSHYCQNVFQYIYPSVCSSYLSPGGNVFTQPGVYFDTIPALNGCDTIFRISLTILQTQSSSFVTACRSYLSPSGNHVWVQPGIYQDTLVNTAGCDSIITINLNFIQVDTAVVQIGSALVSQANSSTFQWIYCDSIPLPGETNNTFQPSVSGNYSLVVTTNGCSDTSRCFPITILENEGIISPSSYIIYPNPAKDNFKIKSPDPVNRFRYQVEDLMGCSKIFSDWKSQYDELSIAELPSGVYFVKIYESTGLVRVLPFTKL